MSKELFEWCLTEEFSRENGTYYEMYNYVKQFADKIDDKNTNGDTPLTIACDMGKIDKISILIDAGANLNLQNKMGRTPLMCLLEYTGGYGLPKELITKMINQTNINIVDDEGYNALHILLGSCCRPDDEESMIATMLIDAGIDINAVNDLGKTPLIYAVNNDLIDIVKLMIRRGYYVDEDDINIFSPFKFNQAFLVYIEELILSKDNKKRYSRTIKRIPNVQYEFKFAPDRYGARFLSYKFNCKFKSNEEIYKSMTEDDRLLLCVNCAQDLEKIQWE